MGWTLRDDEVDSIKELYAGSDRGAAIIAATVVEVRLTDAIKERFVRDVGIENGMFRSSGPLGSFSAKIKLSRLLGICSEEAYRDLENMKNIRNRFAHYLDVQDFEAQRIRDLCKNFRMIDKCVWEAQTGELPNPFGMNSIMGIEGRDEKFKSAKWRYLITAMLFSGSLNMRRSCGPNI